MKSCAIRSDKKKRTYYDKQKGEKTIYKVIAINDGDGGDLGYIYYSNLKVD